MRLVLLVMFIACFPAMTLSSPVTLDPGTAIFVDVYNSNRKTFAIFGTKFPCEGYMHVAVGALTRAIGTVDPATVEKAPQTLVGAEFELKDALTGEFDSALDGEIHGGKLDKICG